MNGFKHSVNVPGNVIIPESQNAVAFGLQLIRALNIASPIGFFAVLRAINFNDELCGHAGEIRNVRADDDLAPEVAADHWMPPQVKPQPRFGRCRMSTHAARR